MCKVYWKWKQNVNATYIITKVCLHLYLTEKSKVHVDDWLFDWQNVYQIYECKVLYLQYNYYAMYNVV